MKIHFTSGAFHEKDWKDKLHRCRECAAAFGWDFGVQLHNTAPAEIIGNLMREKVPLSVHAPLNQDRFWNLARVHIQDTLAAIDRNFAEFEKMGVREVVFHSGLMCDFSPEAFGHGKTYDECMRPVFRPELARYPGRPFNRDFTSEPEYRQRMEVQAENLRLVRSRYPDFLICAENDFPAYTGMNMFFRDMVRLGSPLCLDTGHLWISTHQAGVDFQREVGFAAASGLLRMCHFHSSCYTVAVPADRWSDGHRKLSPVNPEMDLARVFRTLSGSGLDFFVLEIPDADVDDLMLLKRWLEKQGTPERDVGCHG